MMLITFWQLNQNKISFTHIQYIAIQMIDFSKIISGWDYNYEDLNDLRCDTSGPFY